MIEDVQFQPVRVPARPLRYCYLSLASMAEKATDYAGFKGAAKQLEQEFPPDPAVDIEDDW